MTAQAGREGCGHIAIERSNKRGLLTYTPVDCLPATTDCCNTVAQRLQQTNLLNMVFQTNEVSVSMLGHRQLRVMFSSHSPRKEGVSPTIEPYDAPLGVVISEQEAPEARALKARKGS
jgi:hypothetical protein